ncbi:hypothetical protein JL721_11788 [Aureococcus anophagefferens]|nr:hypothetical protein JL721_11788 [Aureococcus anophagefferens]
MYEEIPTSMEEFLKSIKAKAAAHGISCDISMDREAIARGLALEESDRKQRRWPGPERNFEDVKMTAHEPTTDNELQRVMAMHEHGDDFERTAAEERKTARGRGEGPLAARRLRGRHAGPFDLRPWEPAADALVHAALDAVGFHFVLEWRAGEGWRLLQCSTLNRRWEECHVAGYRALEWANPREDARDLASSTLLGRAGSSATSRRSCRGCPSPSGPTPRATTRSASETATTGTRARRASATGPSRSSGADDEDLVETPRVVGDRPTGFVYLHMLRHVGHAPGITSADHVTGGAHGNAGFTMRALPWVARDDGDDDAGLPPLEKPSYCPLAQ